MGTKHVRKPELHQTVTYLRFHKRISQSDIARQLGISRQRVQQVIVGAIGSGDRFIDWKLNPPRYDPYADKFWSKVDRRGPDECWLWQGGRTKRYGRVRFNGQTDYAHRVAWAFRNGPVAEPIPAQVRHTCKNSLCCNPSHLRAVELPAASG